MGGKKNRMGSTGGKLGEILCFYFKEVGGHIINLFIYHGGIPFKCIICQIPLFPTLGPERKRSLSKVMHKISGSGKK